MIDPTDPTEIHPRPPRVATDHDRQAHGDRARRLGAALSLYPDRWSPDALDHVEKAMAKAQRWDAVMKEARR